MDHKDIWLVLGLTVILAVAVSLSTVSLTGNATSIFGKVTKTTISKTPTKLTVPTNLVIPATCKYFGVQNAQNKYALASYSPNEICSNEFGSEYKANIVESLTLGRYHLTKDSCEDGTNTEWQNSYYSYKNYDEKMMDQPTYWFFNYQKPDNWNICVANSIAGSIDQYWANIQSSYTGVICCK